MNLNTNPNTDPKPNPQTTYFGSDSRKSIHFVDKRTV